MVTHPNLKKCLDTYSVAVADFNCGVMLDGVTAGAVSIDPGGRVKLSLFFDILLMVKADHFTVP